MGLFDEVGAAVGGSSSVIEEFRREISKASIPDNGYILSRFKVIKFASDLTLFAFYATECRWEQYPQAKTWEYLTRIANRLDLSWVIARTGAELNDAEYASNQNLLRDKFDCRMLKLFEFGHDIFPQVGFADKLD